MYVNASELNELVIVSARTDVGKVPRASKLGSVNATKLVTEVFVPTGIGLRSARHGPTDRPAKPMTTPSLVRILIIISVLLCPVENLRLTQLDDGVERR
jgi:hypothetical protein